MVSLYSCDKRFAISGPAVNDPQFASGVQQIAEGAFSYNTNLVKNSNSRECKQPSKMLHF